MSSCPSNCTCGSCNKGGTIVYKINSANSDYYINGNVCSACTWNNYTATSCPNNCNCYSNTCGGSTKYSAPYGAKSNYYLGSDYKCYACTWNNYTATSCSANCTCPSNTCGGSTKYGAPNGAKSGYYLKSDGTCAACTWSGYTATSCPSNCTCSSDTCGGSTKYSEPTGANAGYYLKSDGTCAENACTNYTLDSCPTNGNCSNCNKAGTIKYKLDSCKTNYKKSGNTCVLKECSDYDYVDSCTAACSGNSTVTCTQKTPRTGLTCYEKTTTACGSSKTCCSNSCEATTVSRTVDCGCGGTQTVNVGRECRNGAMADVGGTPTSNCTKSDCASDSFCCNKACYKKKATEEVACGDGTKTKTTTYSCSSTGNVVISSTSYGSCKCANTGSGTYYGRKCNNNQAYNFSTCQCEAVSCTYGYGGSEYDKCGGDLLDECYRLWVDCYSRCNGNISCNGDCSAFSKSKCAVCQSDNKCHRTSTPVPH